MSCYFGNYEIKYIFAFQLLDLTKYDFNMPELFCNVILCVRVIADIFR